MTIYRGYDIKAHANGGFYWTDERGFTHTGNDTDISSPIGLRAGAYATEDAAMNAVDVYRRNLRSTSDAA